MYDILYSLVLTVGRWAVPPVVDLSSVFYRSILFIGLIILVLKLKINNLHTWGHAQIDEKLLKLLKSAIFTI